MKAPFKPLYAHDRPYTWVGRKGPDGKFIDTSHPTCSFCGSITVEDVLWAFRLDGMHWSGCDWKYDWPHKFYIEVLEPDIVDKQRQHWDELSSHWRNGDRLFYSHYKFYSRHLIDAEPRQLEQWNLIVKPYTGIGFFMKDGKLCYTAPADDFQNSGTVVTEVRPITLKGARDVPNMDAIYSILSPKLTLPEQSDSALPKAVFEYDEKEAK